MTENTLADKIEIEASNTVLVCKAVPSGVLQSLLAEIASLEGMDLQTPEAMLMLRGPEQAKAIQASERLFNFCVGWGVVNDPPNETSEVMQLMGIRSDQPNMKRAAWIRYDLGATQDELSQIIGIVMALTFGGPGTNGQED